MLKNRFYYAVKPFIPWRAKMALRRIAARHKLKQCHSTWPIDEHSGHAPPGWPGWPGGKRFAVVLTHDVEGTNGLAKCQALAEIEKQRGFRSSFNFIPEGPYRVSPKLRSVLTQDGFEVGVHDLEHNGKLFQSHRTFQKKAFRINQYIHEWGASGYRSGFMLRNLNWMHELDILYDSSTFDTDPFELQPQGVRTVFPFFIPPPDTHAPDLNPKHRVPLQTNGLCKGYIELPYTLPQDSTVFLVLREQSTDIWTRKLDWIANQGGMVLVNVHPDYMRFGSEASSPRTYPSSFYSHLLDYLQSQHSGEYWHALPREVASFVSGIACPPTIRMPKRICMVTHSFYESDNRVTRYAKALAERGDSVDVLALRRSPLLPKREEIDQVNVYRIQDRFGKKERSRLAYLWPWLRFLAASLWGVARRHAKERYDLLHIHNMPDFLVFSALLPRLSGARVILDIHDIVPEFYQSKFSRGKSSLTATLLFFIERQSARFAHHVIVSNHLWLNKYAVRTGTTKKSSVFINNVDTAVFRPQPRTRCDDKMIIIFPGGLQWHQGLDIALRAFKAVSSALPQAEFHIYGDGNMKLSLISLAAELGLNGHVKFFDPVEVGRIARIMANADLGVVPKRADSFGNQAYSTKIMEFMAVGTPVVVSKTQIDQYYFNDSVVRFFESGNPAALTEAILEVLTKPDVRARLVFHGLNYSASNSWESRKVEYLNLVDSLSSRPGVD